MSFCKPPKVTDVLLNWQVNVQFNISYNFPLISLNSFSSIAINMTNANIISVIADTLTFI